MPASTQPPARARRMRAAECRLDDFRELVEQTIVADDVAFADRVECGVPIYDAEHLRAAVAGGARDDVLAELAWVFLDGPGIAVFAGAFPDRSVVDRVSDAFRSMIADQHARGVQIGDHYAKPGANDRVWNAIEKLALLDPDAFVAYYANDIIALAAQAWLGPHYEVSSQVNVVNPGGEAQSPHRDYHLGFLTDAEAEQFPAHVHRLSPMLTLQGAVAHVDMPVESGPTHYLPHSQKYELGYLAWRRPEFIAYFRDHLVQLPLTLGDAVFFNPALFHAAGTNRSTDIHRMANLLQVSSVFGKAMETIDHEAMTNAVYRAILRASDAGTPPDDIDRAITATTDGYSFPGNLDRDPPLAGLAPPTQADIVRRAVAERWAPTALAAELAALAERRRT